MYTTRRSTPADIPLILHFVRELARYESVENHVMATEQDLEEALFGDNAIAGALLCELEGQAVGFGLYVYNFSTWTGKRGIFLESLYVDAEQRGKGAGKAILQQIAELAIAQDCARLEWSVLDWNESSIKFLESMGARALPDLVGYRITGDAIRALAESKAS
ncbi:MAG: GNAT family N-acetyltransferase [Pseudomonadota bacterium]